MTQFKKGTSGNPKGRPPKTKYIPDILTKIGKETPPESILGKMTKMFPDAKDMDFMEAVQRYVYVFALKGHSWAVQYIADRTEGKPVQPIDLNVEDERKPFDGDNAEEFVNDYIKNGLK